VRTADLKLVSVRVVQALIYVTVQEEVKVFVKKLECNVLSNL
jgi:hypothetical protein